MSLRLSILRCIVRNTASDTGQRARNFLLKDPSHAALARSGRGCRSQARGGRGTEYCPQRGYRVTRYLCFDGVALESEARPCRRGRGGVRWLVCTLAFVPSRWASLYAP